MSSLPQFLVAKYTPDLQRMEPRNIGVILASDDAISARFIAEKGEDLGDVDGRIVPSFVANIGAYKQWIGFWRREIQALQKMRKRNAHQCLQYLQQTGIGNFELATGGKIIDTVRTGELPNLTNFLYERLVEISPSDESRDPALETVVDGIIRATKLNKNPEFYSQFRVSCSIAPNIDEQFEFNYALKNGRLKRLFQRVPLSKRQGPLRRAVHDSAWMFEKVTRQGLVSRENAVALVYATDEHMRDPAIRHSLEVLNSVARVANVADQREAISAFVTD